jgi:8-oxo-dGTP diphosphatase
MAQRRRKVSPEEQAFLEAYDPDRFERLSVAVDVALLSTFEGALYVLLVRRSEHPHLGEYQLPGGFVRPAEALDAAAARILESKGSTTGVYLEQLYTFGDPSRDPRTRVVSVAYYALVPHERRFEQDSAGTRILARLEVPWEGESGGPVSAEHRGKRVPLAFDHDEILGVAVKRLRGKLDYAPIGFQLLPKRFTLRQLQDVHEAILGKRINKDSFRRRMHASGLVSRTGEHEGAVGHRPAELYRFRR